jgi:hypothetical protein
MPRRADLARRLNGLGEVGPFKHNAFARPSGISAKARASDLGPIAQLNVGDVDNGIAAIKFVDQNQARKREDYSQGFRTRTYNNVEPVWDEFFE